MTLRASPSGSVVLDIGGGVGAAVVYTTPDLDGSEIEIRRAGSSWDGTHTGVRPRVAGGRVVHAAVFESLTAGVYELRPRGRRSTVTLSVDGGSVTEVLTGWRGR